ncbi:MAG: cell division protein ZapA [Bdellovibrionaceae bacterium]|nr:cell division protein ZapA [Pseudobdellovibrionaceae bacterium]
MISSNSDLAKRNVDSLKMPSGGSATKQTVMSSKEGHTYDFHIAGLPYKLKTNHDDATVQELVTFINKKMEESLAQTKNGSYQNAAVLAALNIAEELILLKRKAHRELEKVEEKILKLAIDIENSKKV